MAFHLADSRTYQRFCRFGITDKPPSKSALHATIKVLRAQTLEQINRILVRAAAGAGIEPGHKVYWGVVVLLLPILMQGPTRRRLPRLPMLLSVSVVAHRRMAPQTPRRTERTGGTLRRRHLPNWAICDGGAEMFRPNAVAIARYRYRGSRIPTPWTSRETGSSAPKA